MAITEARVERLNDLNVATTALFLERGMRTSAWGSFFWGSLAVLSGFLTFTQSPWIGAANYAFGVLLIAEGFYEWRNRTPMAVKVAALTLAALAVWNTFWFILSVKYNRAMGGLMAHPFVTIMQGINAWNAWRSYSVFEHAYQNVKSECLLHVRESIEALRNVKTETALDTVDFEMPETLAETMRWVVRFSPGLALFVGSKKRSFLKTGYAEQVFWCFPEEIEIEQLGEQWAGKKMKVNVRVGAVEFNKALFSQEMLLRLEGMRLSSSA